MKPFPRYMVKKKGVRQLRGPRAGKRSPVLSWDGHHCIEVEERARDEISRQKIFTRGSKGGGERTKEAMQRERSEVSSILYARQ